MDDKVALVTGGSSGIGKAAAIAFAREGAKVVIADIQADKGMETSRMINKSYGVSIFVKADVSRQKDVEKIIKRTVETYGRLDCAFNNAGIEGEQAATADCTVENWDRVMNINLRGVWLCMKYELIQMIKQKVGSIVNTSSVAGRVGFENISPYTASKHGILGLTKAAALEYATSGIRINAVCPGVIQTEMIDRFTGGDKEKEYQLIAKEPMRRMGTPEEVAEAVLWLCSKAASFVTGHSLNVDGGFVAQ
ncbi:SDR family oxidoreductase [Candidatus Poribacteria bacterium]|nr:SDR family oxidoreductase [Candidatus Poribacteria bacterium]